MPNVKEPFFFGASEVYAKGLDWYFNLFKDIDPKKITGEGSTSNFYDHVPYFYNDGHKLKYDHSLPVIPELVTTALPGIKIIICLRDPVQRAVSHYGLWLGKGNVSPFLGIKKPAEERRKLRIIEYGYYAKYLELWKKYVPDNRLQVLIFEEDILDRPNETIQKVYEFLGLDSAVVPQRINSKVNKSKGWSRILLSYYLGERISKLTQRKSISFVFDWLDKLKLIKPLDIKEDEIAFLRSIYFPEKSKIEKLIGRNLDCWKYGVK